MDAADIRHMEVDDHSVDHENCQLEQMRIQSRILREIAAQLAELNSNLRVHTAVSEGGDPRGY